MKVRTTGSSRAASHRKAAPAGEEAVGQLEIVPADQRQAPQRSTSGRLLPVIRTFIALPAGIARMPRPRFHVYTFLGSWPWCFALAYVGYVLGERWDSDPRLRDFMHRFDAVILVGLLALLAWFGWRHWRGCGSGAEIGAPIGVHAFPRASIDRSTRKGLQRRGGRVHSMSSTSAGSSGRSRGRRFPRSVALILEGDRAGFRAQAPLFSTRAPFPAAADAEEARRCGAVWCVELGIRAMTLLVLLDENLAQLADEVSGILGAVEGEGWRAGMRSLDPPASGPGRGHGGSTSCHRARWRQSGETTNDSPPAGAMTLTIAIGYSSREEICDAVRSLLAEQAVEGGQRGGGDRTDEA